MFTQQLREFGMANELVQNQAESFNLGEANAQAKDTNRPPAIGGNRKRKALLILVLVVLLVGLSVTAVSSAPANQQTTCQDYGRLDYNYACRNGSWQPPCPDFGRLDYNYACQNGGWWPHGRN